MSPMTLVSNVPGQPTQSVLDPRGPVAEAVAQLALGMSLVVVLVLASVTALAMYAVLSAPRRVRTRWWLIGGGMAFPATALAALLAWSALFEAADVAQLPLHPLRIEVSGRQWWWEVRYTGPDGKPVVLANELHLPAQSRLALNVTSADVIHALWIPALGGRADMIPGRTSELLLETGGAGVMRAQCAEFCGTQHALMALHVVVEDEAVFQAWLARQAAPALPPVDARLRAGRNAFLRAGCGGCHTVRGTEAGGQIGPDLTHVGSRRTLAAGTLDNHARTLAAWVADSQRIKPGNLMPANANLHGPELHAVAAYLESLR